LGVCIGTGAGVGPWCIAAVHFSETALNKGVMPTMRFFPGKLTTVSLPVAATRVAQSTKLAFVAEPFDGPTQI
jgi:hypothetical protein